MCGTLLVVGAVTARADEATDRMQIQTARDLWLKAFFGGDTKTLDRLETDEFIVITRDIVSDKKNQLEGIKAAADAGNGFPQGITGVDIDVKTHFPSKDVAIVSGHVGNKLPGDEQPSMKFAVTEVWQRTDQGWGVAHLHFHPLEEPKEQ
jgi:ketosteroid isomerase-like protein